MVGGLVIVGRYGDGRDVSYDEASGFFAVGGTPESPDAIRSYRAAGQLEWASAAVADWFASAFPEVRPAAPSALRLSRYAVASLVLGIVCVLWMCLVAGAAIFGPVPEPLWGWAFLFLICGGPLAAVCAVAAVALGATARSSERRRLAIAGIVLGVCFLVPALIYAALGMFAMAVVG